MEISLDRQKVSKHCLECDIDFDVIRGLVYDSNEPIGLYLIALHGHSAKGPMGHLAIALRDPIAPDGPPVAVAMNVIGMEQQYGFELVDWDVSPWRDETYLGVMMDRVDALVSTHRQSFFHIAEHVVDDLPEVRGYFR
jgi:hypothetical protein